MSLIFNLTNTSQRALDGAVMECVRGAVEFLAEKHGFSADEAFAEMNLTKTTSTTKKTQRPKTKALKPSVPLPFCGTLLGSCNGIRVNHGLHSQCMNVKDVCGISGDNLDYCTTCNKQAKSNENGAPNAGDIRARISGEWSVPSKLVSYGNVMEKLNITREKAEEEASKLGLTIPEEEFVVVKGRRGRPKKDSSTTSSSEDEAPKKRGRPKKQKKVIDTSAGDDLISQLVAQAAAETTSSSDSEQEKSSVLSQQDFSDKKSFAKASVEEKKIVAAEKQAKLDAKEAEKQAKLDAKEAEKQAKLEAKEAEKQAKLAAKEAEKQAKLDAKKIAAITAVENAAAAEASDELAEENPSVFGSESDDDDESDDETQSIQAKRITIDGKKYIMDKATNHLYDNDDQSVLGTYYDEAANEIKPIPEDDE